ncbi:MAG: SPASM domain-containing protein, partial [Candidatus Carbobacillus sp.]|nr:SPASM domain-containing protein [Candidatus Carbobacillus sp.]
IKSAYPFEIILAGYEDINEYKKSFVEKEKIFNKRAICTANISQFCILPDGQVTICEELYWQPNFIIGNILTNTIDEIWQSKKALDLYKITKRKFHTTVHVRLVILSTPVEGKKEFVGVMY